MLPRAKSICAGFTFVFALLLSACAGDSPYPNKLPEDVRAFLEKAQTFEVLSLDPEWHEKEASGRFHRYTILGETTVTNAATHKDLLAALEKGIKGNRGDVANCFDPRHGIRAKDKNRRVDLLICFRCLQVAIFEEGKDQRAVLTTSSPEPTFDAVLTKAKVPLAPKAK